MIFCPLYNTSVPAINFVNAILGIEEEELPFSDLKEMIADTFSSEPILFFNLC